LVIAVAVLIALWIAPAVTLLTATTAYALSGPLLWFRRRHTPVQDTHV
jgi:CDP-diacylglycerol--serine O-phosphatidyltransferase